MGIRCTHRPITLQNSPSNPAVLLPERFRAETCAFGAFVRRSLGQSLVNWRAGGIIAAPSPTDEPDFMKTRRTTLAVVLLAAPVLLSGVCLAKDNAAGADAAGARSATLARFDATVRG